MKKIKVYSTKTKTVGEMSLPKDWVEKVEEQLLAQALRVYEDRQHRGLARTKTRGEIARTTRKWYRQKGTGRARHGAQSAPIFVGGGKAHGPKGMKRELKLPKKMRERALKMVIGLKLQEGALVAIEGISGIKKAKEARAFLDRFLEKGRKFTLVLDNGNWERKRFWRNLDGGNLVRAGSLNAYQVFMGGTVVLDKEMFAKKGKEKKKND